MYAIVDFVGQQMKVEKEGKIFVHRLAAAEDTTVEFDKVLLLDNDGKIEVGAPYIAGCKIKAKVLSHMKGDKVMVFQEKKKKRIPEI